MELGCTVPKIANVCSHKTTKHKFYLFFEGDMDFCEKTREHVTGGLSIVGRRKADVVQTYIRNSSIVCKTIVGIDASQVHPFSVCQELPT